MIYQCSILGDSSIYIFDTWTVNIIMSLHTDTVDRYTGILHLLHHIEDAVALSWIGGIIVIIEQKCFRVCFTGKFKSLGYEFITTQLKVSGLTVRARFFFHPWHTTTITIRHRFVYYIPCIYNVLITVYNCMDMSTQTFIEHFFAYFFSFFIYKHPIGELAMPAQAMSTKRDVVFTTEIGNLIRIFPIELTFFGLQRYGFHIVFSRNTIKVLLDKCNLFWIGHITHIHCYTYRKVVFISILISCRVFYRLTASEPLRRNIIGC